MMMLRAHFDVEAANLTINEGSAGPVIDKAFAVAKPEAVYFIADKGQRGVVERPGVELRLQGVEAPEHRATVDAQSLSGRLHRAAALDLQDEAKVIPFQHGVELPDFGDGGITENYRRAGSIAQSQPRSPRRRSGRRPERRSDLPISI